MTDSLLTSQSPRSTIGSPRKRRSWLSQLRKSNWPAHLLLFVVIFLVLLPILWLVATSFKDAEEFYTNPAALLPRQISLVNFEYMFTAINQLPIYMRNSFILAFGVTIIQVTAASMAGYAFARIKFRGAI